MEKIQIGIPGEDNNLTLEMHRNKNKSLHILLTGRYVEEKRVRYSLFSMVTRSFNHTKKRFEASYQEGEYQDPWCTVDQIQHFSFTLFPGQECIVDHEHTHGRGIWKFQNINGELVANRLGFDRICFHYIDYKEVSEEKYEAWIKSLS